MMVRLVLHGTLRLQESKLALLQEVSANAALALEEKCCIARQVVAECRLARFDLAATDYTKLNKASLPAGQVNFLAIECDAV